MWGLTTFTYPWAFGLPGYPTKDSLTLEDLLERAARFGAQVVQIAHNTPLHLLEERTIKRLRELAREKELVLEIGTLGTRRDHLEMYLAIAEMLDARLLRTILDEPHYSPSLEEAKREIRSVLPLFAEKNIYLVLENYERKKKEDLHHLFTEIDHPYFRFCFDTANSLGAFEDPHEVLKLLAPYTINVHLKDVVAFRPPYQLGFVIEGRPLGQGSLGVQWVFDTLCGQKEVTYLIELLTPWQGSMEKSITTEAEWAQESVRFLKEVMSHEKGK